MADDQPDVIEILVHDHREVEQIFAGLERLVGMNDPANHQRRKELVDEVTSELVRHFVAEETEVYPRVREKVSYAEAEQAKHEHAAAEVTLKRLESLEPGDVMFEQRVALLMQQVREHVREEEGQMFPHMRSIFTRDELLTMGAAVERVKKLAPTRPHPWAPDQPPGDKVLGPITGLFDRMRDARSHRGTD